MKRIDPARVLPPRPFITGMRTSLDIYGVSGLTMYKRIQRHWSTAVSQPRPSAEESIRETVATVNGEFLGLLADHED